MRSLVFFICLAAAAMISIAQHAHAIDIALSWDAPTINADGSGLTDLATYTLKMRNAQNQVTSFPGLTVTSYTVQSLPVGTYFFTVTATDTSGNESAPSNEYRVVLGSPAEDSDGDGVPDDIDNCPALANPDQLDLNQNLIGDACEQSGSKRNAIIDFDKDGISDTTRVARSKAGLELETNLSKSGRMVSFTVGAKSDLLALADYDGDGGTDLAVIRRLNGLLYWQIHGLTPTFDQSTGIREERQFLAAGDRPLINCDFDGDSKADLAGMTRGGLVKIQLSQSGNTLEFDTKRSPSKVRDITCAWIENHGPVIALLANKRSKPGAAQRDQTTILNLQGTVVGNLTHLPAQELFSFDMNGDGADEFAALRSNGTVMIFTGGSRKPLTMRGKPSRDAVVSILPGSGDDAELGLTLRTRKGALFFLGFDSLAMRRLSEFSAAPKRSLAQSHGAAARAARR